MAPVTAAKEQTASAPTSLLPETRVWALRPKGEARTGPTAWVSSTARWGYEHFYDGTVVGSLVSLDYAVNRSYSRGVGKVSDAGSVPGEWGGPGEIQGVGIDTGIREAILYAAMIQLVSRYRGGQTIPPIAMSCISCGETDRGWSR